jgi:FAD-linked oxidoreductase
MNSNSAAAPWRNWSGLQQAQPALTVQPADEQELATLVRDAEQLRVVGAGHSFTALVPTAGTLVSLDRLTGLIDHDDERQRARLWAGTRLHEVGPLLQAIGQALPNMGDIDRQSLAGVLSTATHGTGAQLPCIAAGLTELRLITAQGEVLECSRERDAELFRAAAVSLGALGVITQAQLQNVASYRLRERVWALPLPQVFAELERLKRDHRHFEFWAFPGGNVAIVKVLDISEDAVTEQEQGADSQDGLLQLCSELSRLLPPLAPHLQRLVARFVKPSERVNGWYRVFPSARNVRFNEMEYHVPAERGPACMGEVCRELARDGRGVFFPVEYRYVAGDDYLLSPFGDGPRASIAVHQYYKQDHRPLFERIEPILRRHGGRPHWGKLHTVDAAGLRELYPQLGTFLRLRAELDPRGKFLNPYLRALFGVG